MGALRQKLWYYGVVGVLTVVADGLQFVCWAMNSWCDYIDKSRNPKEGR